MDTEMLSLGEESGQHAESQVHSLLQAYTPEGCTAAFRTVPEV